MTNGRPVNAVFHDARVIDPLSGRDGVGDVVVIDGAISGNADEVRADCVHVDCRGLVLAPAFIDLHCHLREPGFEDKETVATGTAAAAAGGFGVVCCMPNTRPPLDTAARILSFGELLRKDARVRVLPIAAVTLGRRGQALVDIRGLAACGVVGFSDDGDYVADTVVMRDALSQAGGAGLPVIDHAQEGRLVAGGVLHEGAVAKRLKLRGMPAEAEELAVARDIALARLTGAHVHIAHITTARAVQMVRQARDEGVWVTAEATPHHMLLTDEDAILSDASGMPRFNNNAKVNPPLRSREDAAAVALAVKEGVVDAIATDHAPHAQGDKMGTPGEAAFGISGFDTALAAVLTASDAHGLSLPQVIRALTAGPAEVLKQELLRPSLLPGLPANLVLFDPDSLWTVDASRFVSRGRNTPLEGRTLRGRVLLTVVEGCRAYVADSLRKERVRGDWLGGGVVNVDEASAENPNVL